jgi:hypothetical protein
MPTYAYLAFVNVEKRSIIANSDGNICNNFKMYNLWIKEKTKKYPNPI